MPVRQAQAFFAALTLNDFERQVGGQNPPGNLRAFTLLE
jgi:hypothetical protein